MSKESARLEVIKEIEEFKNWTPFPGMSKEIASQIDPGRLEEAELMLKLLELFKK